MWIAMLNVYSLIFLQKGLVKLSKYDMMLLVHRGYSLMVKLQPSKLIMRVRFPLPAFVLYHCLDREIPSTRTAPQMPWSTSKKSSC